MPASQASAVPRVIDVRLRPPAPWFVDMSLYRLPTLRPRAAALRPNRTSHRPSLVLPWKTE